MHEFSCYFYIQFKFFESQNGNTFLRKWVTTLQLLSPKNFDTEKTLYRNGVPMFNKNLTNYVGS